MCPTANAEEIAATAGVDVIILGNNDLSSFSGWAQNDPRYQDAVIKVHDAALNTASTSATQVLVPERLRRQRRHAHGAERTGARWMGTTAGRRRRSYGRSGRSARRTRPRQYACARSGAGDRAAGEMRRPLP